MIRRGVFRYMFRCFVYVAPRVTLIAFLELLCIFLFSRITAFGSIHVSGGWNGASVSEWTVTFEREGERERESSCACHAGVILPIPFFSRQLSSVCFVE